MRKEPREGDVTGDAMNGKSGHDEVTPLPFSKVYYPARIKHDSFVTAGQDALHQSFPVLPEITETAVLEL